MSHFETGLNIANQFPDSKTKGDIPMSKAKSFSILLSGLILAQSALVYGQNIGTVNPIVGGSGNSFIGTSGDYNINQVTQDNTKVMLSILERTNQIQDIDRQYLLSISERMNSKLNEINNLRMKLVKMSRALELQKLADFISIINDVEEKNQALILDLATSTTITRESLPSFSPVQVGNMSATVNNFGNVDLSKLTKDVDSQRKLMLDNMNNLKIRNLVSPVGQPVEILQNALNPDLKGIRILTKEQIQDMTLKVQLAMTLDESTVELQQKMVDQTVNLVNSFVNNYGSSEWLRFTDDNDGKARVIAFKQVTDAFMRRSFLRKKYGIRMGAIQSDGYPKQIVNFEQFALQPIKLALKSLKREAAVSDTELQAAFESARNFVQLYDEKVTPVLKSKDVIMKNEGKQMEFSSSDTGFIVKANSALTYLTGQRATAEVLLSIMRLVLSDVREEMMLSQNSIEEMKSYHDAKYRSTNELKQDNNKRICEIDFTLSQEVHNRNCKAIGVNTKATQIVGGNGKSMAEIFSTMMNNIEYIEKASRQDAVNAKKILDAAIRAGNDQEEQDSKDDGLFN